MAFPISTAALADELRQIRYGEVPPWILPRNAGSPSAQAGDAPFQIIYQDTQERIANGAEESFNSYGVRILKPEALTFGNINIFWMPSAGSATVHYVRIIRDGKTIDVLKQEKFKILERAAGLEQSMLDGALTAALQVPGLQVGDELEFAGTIVQATPAFGNHAAGVAQLPFAGLPGTYRYRLLWPESQPLAWRATKDLPAIKPTTAGNFKSLLVELRDPPSVGDVDGAPPRFNRRRAIEYSDFSSWAELSRQTWPLFDKASQLAPDSPLRTEAAKIGARYSNPGERALAALRLVQDQIRYVYVGLNGGNYQPALADDTWRRRFGDCKAKTAVLLALLRQLGVEAEPVLVNTKGGDGTNERLPSPVLFDHVLVRANVSGRRIWLDGTRLGDRSIDPLPQPPFAWALPLTASGTDLIPVAPSTSRYPQFISVLDIDSSGGIAKPAVYTVKHIYHGDDAFELRTKLASMAASEADRAVKRYWHAQFNEVEAQETGWTYDERHASLVLRLKGQGKVDWDGDGVEGHSFDLPGAGFTPPDRLERPKDQNQNAAWAVEYPRFRCWATTIHLPPPTGKLRWSYSSKPVNRRLGGVIYWRSAGMRGNVVRTVMSRQSYAREVTAAEAAQANTELDGFDRYISRVEETSSAISLAPPPLPYSDDVDWVANPSVCSPDKPAAQSQIAQAKTAPKTEVVHAEQATSAKLPLSIETIALPSEQAILNDFLSGVARAGSNPRALLEAADKTLPKLAAPTRLRGFVQLMRAGALAELNRDLDALDAVQESARLLPGYSAPLLTAASIYTYLNRPKEGADYLIRAIEVDPQAVRTVDDYEIGGLMMRLNTAHDEPRVRMLSDRLLEIGWLGTRLGSRSNLATEAIKRRLSQGDIAGARALVPKILIPGNSYSLLVQNEYRPLWPDIETWAGPRLERQWKVYLTEAHDRWAASKSAQASQDYLNALIAAGHYKTAVRDLLPLFGKADRLEDYDLIFAVSPLAQTLARLGRWKDGEDLFERAQKLWPLEEHANALNVAANYARFLLYEGKPGEGLKRMDAAIAQARKWGPQVNSNALGEMYHYRACMLHDLGRASEAGVSKAAALASVGLVSAVSLHLCLNDPQAAKKAVLAGLQKDESRNEVILLMQQADDDPLPGGFSKKLRAGLDTLRADPDILREIAKYGRIIPWRENAGAPAESP